MKSFYSFLLLALITVSSFAQVKSHNIDPTNCREGESVEYCTEHKKMAELMKNPAFMKINAADQAIMKQREEEMLNERGQERAQVYVIPVVFHVLHNGGVEKIGVDQCLDALAILNRDYSLQNTDANNVVSDFQGMPANIEIQFALATIAPNGQCFRGVTYTNDPLTFDGSNGNAQVNAIINGNDVYQGQWSGDQYLNVFICADIGGAAGYTYNPSNWIGSGMNNGIWVLHNYVGSIGTSTSFTSRTLTHEVGHWLNLSHTWGDNNNPGTASSCGIDDHVSDTPVTIGVTSCNLNYNSCDDLNTASGVTSSWTYDVVDNVENYMDYSYCSKMFTPGQKSRMRAAITSSVAGRNNVWTTSNLNAVGANGNAPLCAADFSAPRTTICQGDALTFSDQSYHNQNSWSWSFTGASPSTSTTQNPTVTYSTPGTYAVSLSVSDGSSTVSTTKNAYITVLPTPGLAAPIAEGFENGTTNWYTFNADGGNTFTLTTAAAATDSHSMQLINSSNTGDVDELISTAYDLSNMSQVTLTFKYAFAQKSTSNSDALQVLATNNCGSTWAVRKNISNSQLPTAPATSSNFVPTSTQWNEVTVTSITSTFFVNNFQFKFKFISGGGNNVYIDDINLYGTDLNGNPVGSPGMTNTGIEELNPFNVSLYPNPASGSATLALNNLNKETKTEIILVDMVGKQVATVFSGNATGTQQFEIPLQNLSKGVYFVNIYNGTSVSTHKLIVE